MGSYKHGCNRGFIGLIGLIGFRVYKWGYKSPVMGYNCSYLTYNPTYKLSMNLQAGL